MIQLSNIGLSGAIKSTLVCCINKYPSQLIDVQKQRGGISRALASKVSYKRADLKLEVIGHVERNYATFN